MTDQISLRAKIHSHPSPDCAQRKSGAHIPKRLRLWAPGSPLTRRPGGGWRAALFAFAIFLCAAPAHAQRNNPAYDDITEQGQDLAECAGIVSSVANLNPVTHPHTGAEGDWPTLLSTILVRLHTEPGLQGMTGRYAASAARSFWAQRPRAARTAAANRCRERFGG